MMLRQRRWKMLWMLAGAAILDFAMGAGIWAMFYHPLQLPQYADEVFLFFYILGLRTLFLFMGGLFAWGTWRFIVMFARPATLTLSTEGLAYHGAFKQQAWRWNAICGFRVWKSSKGTPVGVAFEVHDPADPKTQMGYLPAGWPLSIRGVIGYLEEGQRHYLAGPPPPVQWPDGPPPPPFGPGPGQPWKKGDLQTVAWLGAGLFGLAAFLLVAGLSSRAHQRRTDVFLTAPAFEHAPGCPTSLRVGEYLPHRCWNDRYDVGGNSARFNLPVVSSKSSRYWVRIGADAVELNCRYSGGCRAEQVVAGKFAPHAAGPSRQRSP